MNSGIILRNVSKKFGDNWVLKEVSLQVKPDERCVITGSNGTGKSTLLRCIALLEPIDEGEIILNGKRIVPTTSRAEIAAIQKEQLFGYVFQDLQLWPHLSTLENLTLPLTVIKNLSSEQAIKTALEIIALVGLTEKQDEFPSFLSGGQQRRLLIARTLVMNPEMLLLDEITANLDYKLKKAIYALIAKIAQGKTTLIVSHEPELLEGQIDRTYLLKEGRLEVTTHPHFAALCHLRRPQQWGGSYV